MIHWLGTPCLGLAFALAVPLAASQVDPPGSSFAAHQAVDLGHGRQLAAPIVRGNLTVWPIVGPERQDLGRFLSLAEAQERGLARVTERGDASSNSSFQNGVGQVRVQHFEGNEPVRDENTFDLEAARRRLEEALLQHGAQGGRPQQTGTASQEQAPPRSSSAPGNSTTASGQSASSGQIDAGARQEQTLPQQGRADVVARRSSQSRPDVAQHEEALADQHEAGGVSRRRDAAVARQGESIAAQREEAVAVQREADGVSRQRNAAIAQQGESIVGQQEEAVGGQTDDPARVQRLEQAVEGPSGTAALVERQWSNAAQVLAQSDWNGQQLEGNLRLGQNDGATVGELILVNDADVPVVVVAGTVVKGGNQDRQIAQDFVVPPKSSIPVGAFCIEQGRWTSLREGQDNGGLFEAQGFVSNKNIRTSGQYTRNQSDVWQNVAAVNGKTGKAPQTGTFLATAEEDDVEALQLREALREAIDAGFEAVKSGAGPAVLGFAYSVDGEPIGARAFANQALFEKFFPVFLNTMCMEAQTARAQDESAGKPGYDRPAPVEALHLVLTHISDSETQRTPTPGLADVVRRTNEWGGNSSCVLCLDGHDVVLTEDWTTPATFSEEACTMLKQLEALGYTLGDG